jgi:TRAP-type C4-dicarboxylate transport system substrate-binding protein
MKKFLTLVSLLGVLLLVLSIIGCSQPASTPAATVAAPATKAPAPTSAAPSSAAPAPAATTPSAPAPATTAAKPSPSAAANVIVLSLAPINCGPPPAQGLTLVLSQWVDLIKTKSGGRVKIDPYWGQTLSPVNQIVNATSTGVADIGAVAQAQEPGKLPLSMVCQLPGFGTDYRAQCLAFWDLMNQEPLLSEYAKYNLLPIGVNFVPDYYLISTKPINTAADLKGKKIAAAGFIAQTLSSLGAVPVAMSPGEQYEGMQKGTIDGDAAPYSAISDFKFYEVAKYIENFPFGGRVQPILINKNSWNKLPPDIQNIFKGAIPDIIQFNIDATLGKGQPLYPLTAQVIQDNKIQLIQVSDADVAAVAKVQAGQADAWAAEQDKAGLPGKKLLDDYRAAVNKYMKTSTPAK